MALVLPTIGRAELAAIAAALIITHTRCHRQPRLTSPTQKASPVSREAQASYEIAKYQASLKDINLADTGIPRAGPGGDPFNNIAWLAREEARPITPESSPIPNLVYFPELKDALKSHMHAKHRQTFQGTVEERLKRLKSNTFQVMFFVAVEV
eukprot:1160848-Pelagomonas_calceolata.AAC.2